MTQDPPRILIVELVNADQFPGRISYLTPILMGYFRDLHLPVRWVRFGISTTNQLENQSDHITLKDVELSLLGKIAKEHQPSFILLTDSISPPQAEGLHKAAPGATLFYYQRETFNGIPGYRKFNYHRELDGPEFMPYYKWEAGNDAANIKEIDNIYLIVAGGCGHNRGIKNNPLYPESIRALLKPKTGCMFCNSRQHWLGDGGVDLNTFITPLEWIEKQVQGIIQSRGVEHLPNALLVEKVEHSEVVQKCLECMQNTGMAEKVQLMFAVRTNLVTPFQRLVDDHFRRFPESPIKFGVHASGIESFSAYDLLLFNKGTTPLSGLKTVNVMRELRDRFPGNFWYTGLSFILFTPWTTLENLHLNVGLYRFLGLSGKEAGNFFQARIRLHRNLPLTRLAEYENLLMEDESDSLLVMNRRKLFEQECSWRFADPRLRPLSRIVLRFDFLDRPSKDELTQRIEDYLLALDPCWKQSMENSLLDFMLWLIEAIKAEQGVLSEDELLKKGAALWQAETSKSLSVSSGKRFRIGEKKYRLLEFLRLIAPILKKGIKPAISLEKVALSEIAGNVTEFLEIEGFKYNHRTSEGRGGNGALIISPDNELLDELVSLQERGPQTKDQAEHREAVFRTGLLYGYPACCARAYADGIFAAADLPVWAVFQKRSEEPLDISLHMQPLLIPSLSFTPCSMKCRNALERLQRWHNEIEIEDDHKREDKLAWLFSFDHLENDDFIALPVHESDNDSLCYDPGMISSGKEETRCLLKAGNVLRFVPGQIRIYNNTELVAWLTASHGVWYHEQCWHPDEWAELAKGAVYVDRLRRETPTKAPVATNTPSPFVRWAGDVIDRTSNLISKHTGFSVQDIILDADRLRIRMIEGEKILELVVIPAEGDAPVFKKGQYCAVSHEKNTPADTKEKVAALDCVLYILESAAGR